MAAKKPFAWSLSRLGDFETCPLKYKFKVIDKMKEPPNKYTERGNFVHKLAEDYLNKKLRTLPKELKNFSLQMTELRKVGAVAEQQIAFTREWKQTDWFAPDCWFRIKVDAHHYNKRLDQARLIDFKTGKVRTYQHQAELTAVTGFLIYPEVQQLQVQFWFIDHKVIQPERPKIYVRSKMLRGTQKMYELRAARVEAEKKFLPKAGSHCSYCAFSKRKGGPCKF